MSSTAEMYAFFLQHEEPNNYSRIPNIISHLTYDYICPKTGEKSIRKLSVYARELYRVIKQTCGDDNLCWKSLKHLGEECGMSVHSVSDARRELEKPFHQLGGESLIKTTKHQKATQKDGKIINKTIYYKSTIVNIWGHNNAFFKMQKEIKTAENQMKKEEGQIPNGNAPGGADSQWERAPQEAGSHCAYKQKTDINIPLSKEQQHTAAAAFVASHKSKNRLFPSEEKRKAYEWMIQKQCSEGIAYKMACAYSTDDIQKASDYMIERMKSGKLVPKKQWAYFQNTLQNRYWEKKV